MWLDCSICTIWVLLKPLYRVKRRVQRRSVQPWTAQRAFIGRDKAPKKPTGSALIFKPRTAWTPCDFGGMFPEPLFIMSFGICKLVTTTAKQIQQPAGLHFNLSWHFKIRSYLYYKPLNWVALANKNTPFLGLGINGFKIHIQKLCHSRQELWSNPECSLESLGCHWHGFWGPVEELGHLCF